MISYSQSLYCMHIPSAFWIFKLCSGNRQNPVDQQRTDIQFFWEMETSSSLERSVMEFPRCVAKVPFTEWIAAIWGLRLPRSLKKELSFRVLIQSVACSNGLPLSNLLGTSTLKSRTQSIEPGSTFDEYGGRMSVVMFFMPTGQQSSGGASGAFQQTQWSCYSPWRPFLQVQPHGRLSMTAHHQKLLACCKMPIWATRRRWILTSSVWSPVLISGVHKCYMARRPLFIRWQGNPQKCSIWWNWALVRRRFGPCNVFKTFQQEKWRAMGPGSCSSQTHWIWSYPGGRSIAEWSSGWHWHKNRGYWNTWRASSMCDVLNESFW